MGVRRLEELFETYKTDKRIVADMYINLEKQYNTLVDTNKKSKDTKQKMRNTMKCREIRYKQNNLYPLLAELNIVDYVQKELGVKSSVGLYLRYYRHKGRRGDLLKKREELMKALEVAKVIQELKEA